MDVASADELDAHELPSNLHALEAEQLAAVAAALGLPGETVDGKAALIRTIESAALRGRTVEAGLAGATSGALEDSETGAGVKRQRKGEKSAALQKRQQRLLVGALPRALPSRLAVGSGDSSDSEVVLVSSTAAAAALRKKAP